MAYQICSWAVASGHFNHTMVLRRYLAGTLGLAAWRLVTPNSAVPMLTHQRLLGCSYLGSQLTYIYQDNI